MDHEFESKHRGTWEGLEGGKGKGKKCNYILI